MSLFHAGLQPALDSNGDPISGATWNFYLTGTTTPAAVYSDDSLSTSLGSTVTANSAGRFSTMFLDDGVEYRAILKDAGGATIKDIDPINPGLVTNVSSRSAMATARTGAGRAVLLTEGGREGYFVWNSADLSAEVTVDDRQGVYVAPSSDTTGASGAWERVDWRNGLNPLWFGATGVASQTLLSTNYVTDTVVEPITITQQTVDGLALNAAIRLLRHEGAGTIRIPPGDFSTYGYLEKLDFPIRIIGSGRGVTQIRNCLLSPHEDGYGIFIIEPEELAEITFSDLTLDGRHEEVGRTAPSGEMRVYPIAAYGLPKLTLDRIESINSGIDCFLGFYDNGDNGAYVRATDCLFSNSFRNTVSNVSGWNQSFTNCIIEKAGKVGAGIAPKCCIDIEPNFSTEIIKNITYTSCLVRKAGAGLVTGVWAGSVKFIGCTFEASEGDSSTRPFFGDMRGGEFDFYDCTFKSTDGNYARTFQCGVPETTGEYAQTQYVNLDGCTIEGGGINGYGQHMIFNGVTVKNSRRPVILEGVGTERTAVVNNLTLLNVFDDVNAGGGRWASFAVTGSFDGNIKVNGINAVVEPSSWPAGMTTSFTQQHGFYLNNPPAGAAALYRNLHAEGYYRKLPTHLGQALSTVNYNDWELPAGAPADSATQTLTLGANFYRSCTMYGDVA